MFSLSRVSENKLCKGSLCRGYSLASPFTMSRAYWLRSRVTDASRLEIAKWERKHWPRQSQAEYPFSSYCPEMPSGPLYSHTKLWLLFISVWSRVVTPLSQSSAVKLCTAPSHSGKNRPSNIPPIPFTKINKNRAHPSYPMVSSTTPTPSLNYLEQKLIWKVSKRSLDL